MIKLCYGRGTLSPCLMAAFAWLVITPASAQAVVCYEPSPSVIAGDSIFEDKTAAPLSATQQRSLQAFLRKIDRRWQGDARRVTCVGSEHNARQVERRTSLAMDVDGDYRRAMTFRSEVYNPERKSRYSEKFSLYQVDGFLRMDSRGPDGDIEIMHIGTTELIYLQRYFVRKVEPAGPEEEKPEPPATIQPLPIQPVQPVTSIRPVDEVTTQPVQSIRPGDGRKRMSRPTKDIPEEEIGYSPGGILNEVVRHLVINGQRLQIETTVYANGLLASSETWQLK
ncbi:hypothetical protein [Endozoicomonas sp. SCSIO W0465]|uniref:hypothetical protein n=1 Tax=Endozoicomonas sp. SCSIO W0465 TaxID=2918516 RepID=UPI002075D17E|nr:hypothetical protein [Endozoicomonas sp. SCSIO W0465]USE35946.1 hypothetical protein MJO57_28445 [Endozoicomonas sp. SCSIO W0465]